MMFLPWENSPYSAKRTPKIGDSPALHSPNIALGARFSLRLSTLRLRDLLNVPLRHPQKLVTTTPVAISPPVIQTLANEQTVLHHDCD
jgi:hypothetical protein